MKNPDITVITACLPTVDDHLRILYDSIRHQKETDWEWSIVFDGDPGDHWLFYTKDPRIIINVNDKNKGAAHSRNTAVLASNSEIVRNIDADDYLFRTDALSRIVTAFQNEKVGFSLAATIDDYGNSRSRFTPKWTPHGIIPTRYIGDSWAEKQFLDFRVHTLSIRKDLYWKMGGYRALDFAEDMLLVCSANDVSIGWLDPEPLSVYRKWERQMSAAPVRPWQLNAVYESWCYATGREPTRPLVT